MSLMTAVPTYAADVTEAYSRALTSDVADAILEVIVGLEADGTTGVFMIDVRVDVDAASTLRVASLVVIDSFLQFLLRSRCPGRNLDVSHLRLYDDSGSVRHVVATISP